MLKKILSAVFILSFLLPITHCDSSRKHKIEIAVATDLSKEGAENDTIFLGANLMVQEINEKGGIFGKQLILSAYDDEGTAEGAKKAAEQIVADGRAVAVIGHRLSSASIAAGPSYATNKIPVITPASTSPDVTKNNDWYFRALFDNDFLGGFLAHYTANVLQPDTLFVVHGSSEYEKKLAEVFVSTATSVGINTATPFLLKGNNEQLRQDSIRIADKLQTKTGNNSLFLALYPETATPLIKALRDQSIALTLLGPDTLAKKSFPQGFANLPSEKRKPGFYTDGIQVATPLVFDTANWQAGMFREEFVSRFNLAPDWRAAYAYDTAGTLAEAIRRSEIFSQNKQDIAAERLAIREALKGMNDYASAYQGITGLNFFNEKGDANKPVAIAEFQARELVSAFRQLQTLSQVPTGARLEKIEEDLGALDIGGTLMEKTNVVYTGVDIDKVSDIKAREMRANVSGSIWFRYKKPKESGHLWRGSAIDFNPANIDFPNAIGDVKFEPIGKLVVTGDTYYQRFSFDGTFRNDFVPGLKKYEAPTVGISYRHLTEPSGRLLYVPDVVGMGLTGDQSYADTLGSSKYYLLAEGWAVQKASVFQGTKWVRIYGQPEFLNSSKARNPHSMISAAIRVGSNDAILSNKIPDYLFPNIALIATLLFAVIFVIKKIRRNNVPALLVMIEIITAIVSVLSGRQASINILQNKLSFDQLTIIDAAFSSLLWIICAYFIVWLIDRIVWAFVEQKTERSVPAVARLFVAAIVYMIAGFGIVAFVLDQPLTSLLATSGLLTFIVGLAVQGNLANIFSGLMISIDRPFVIGDYIEFNGQWGKIIEMGWRATSVEDIAGNTLCVPNSAIADATVLNYKQPAFKYFQSMIEVYVSPDADSVLVAALLRKAISSAKGVLANEGVSVGFKGTEFNGKMSASKYRSFFFCESYEASWRVKENVWSEIQKELAQNHISLDLRENLLNKTMLGKLPI